MILSEFIRVNDISWEAFLWGSLWAVLIIIVFNFMVMMSLIPTIYDWLIKYIIPKWYDKKMGKLQDEIKRLKNDLKTMEIERDKLKARFVMAADNFENGRKGE